jgi:hypothetical protein
MSQNTDMLYVDCPASPLLPCRAASQHPEWTLGVYLLELLAGFIGMQEEAQAFPKMRPVWPWAVALAAAFGIGAAGWWQAARPTPLRPLIRLTAELGPDTAMDSRSLIALLPDGTRLVFTMRTPDGKGILAVRNLSDGLLGSNGR